MNTTKVLLPLICLLLTLASGVLRGRIDHRWGPTEEMRVTAERLEELPRTIGPWQATGEFSSLDEETVKMLRCTGNVYADYVDPASGEKVSVILMYGPAGPLAVHTPDVCYASSNFTQRRDRRRETIAGDADQTHEFWSIEFEENAVGNRPLQVTYGWKSSEAWVAPHEARTAFAGIPVLHKVQVASHDVTQGSKVGAGVRFLSDALPILEEICK